jgi:hypothetical protein
MAHTKTYIVAENWGKGFIEHSESAKFHNLRISRKHLASTST